MIYIFLCDAIWFTRIIISQVASRLASASLFVQRLQESNSSDCVRGPHIAHVEIEKQRCLNGIANDGKLIEALVKYFRRFVLVLLFAQICMRLQQFVGFRGSILQHGTSPPPPRARARLSKDDL
jgi:hypothetical protein